jgi:predicted house-cleaning NTP pyrophosphatase (Maf/HAM1 superfamily)
MYLHLKSVQDDILKAYVDHGEGHDRAGGFAIQVSVSLCFRWQEQY